MKCPFGNNATCTAPNTQCHYWAGTFCALDVSKQANDKIYSMGQSNGTEITATERTVIRVAALIETMREGDKT